MKELTTEQKAKAYDEAIEKAKKELQTCGSTDCDAARQIYRFFPELKESKDEMIRKMCMRYLDREYQHCSFADDKKNIEKCIAWLEKQDEPKQEENDQKCEPFRIKKGEWYVCIHDFCNKAIRIGEIIQAEHDDTIRGIGFLYMENKYFRPAFENEIPQKPKWTDEDEERLQSCIITLQGKGLMGGVDTMDSKWLKSLKQRMEE